MNREEFKKSYAGRYPFYERLIKNVSIVIEERELPLRVVSGRYNSSATGQERWLEFST